MDFETRWLEDFLALAEEQNFSRAAERRHITQPAFSRRIKALEQALDVSLFNRSATPVQLTAEGQLFHITARNVMTQLHESVRQLRGLAPNRQQTLRVAAAHSLAFTFFPDWMQEHDDLFHDWSLRLVAMNVEAGVHALREGRCDLLQVYYDSFSTLQLDAEVFPSLPLSQTTFVPVCRPMDAAGTPEYSLDDPAHSRIPLLAYAPGAFLGRTLRLILKDDPLTLKLHTRYETAMAEGLKGMALKGTGVAWVPKLCIERELAQGDLVICGSERWHAPLEIRLYRCTLINKSAVNQLWQRLTAAVL
ncbi:MAG: LysR family transcriptional regulator [Natronospirillum sp.]|uniref:LysR family transcriptional regulator n=1 Tax=Natronospirillum sp. TaxID=2812955 RepID=UPI0025FB45C4|nr:LysR family transcriptional regulator [Natronospirillum sp.]MCH8552474.1 LysR family transcriptional regulator [Natronospirillum sp.]